MLFFLLRTTTFTSIKDITATAIATATNTITGCSSFVAFRLHTFSMHINSVQLDWYIVFC